MKKLLFLIALALPFAHVAPAQFVASTLAAQQHGAGGTFPAAKQPCVQCSGVATCTFTFGSAITPGTNVGAYIVSNGSTSTCLMTGETVTRIPNASNNSGFQADFWLISKANGGQTVMTCTTGSSSSDLGVAFEVTNPTASAASLDASGNVHDVTGALSVSTSTATTTTNEIVIAAWAIPGFTMSSPGAGYSLFSGSSFTDSIPIIFATPGTIATQTATATSSGGTNNPGFIVTLK